MQELTINEITSVYGGRCLCFCQIGSNCTSKGYIAPDLAACDSYCRGGGGRMCQCNPATPE